MTESSLDQVGQTGLTSSSVAAYLSTTGWSMVHDGRALQSWIYGDVPTPDQVLQLPTDDSYADYDQNLRRVLRQLQALNGWDAQQLATHVLGARSDILYIRASQYSSDGSIPVREAQQLLDGAVDMVTAAARWTYQPRRSFSGRPPDAVKEFIDDDLRMGHTQRGSFVITILTRLDEPEIDQPGDRTPVLVPPAEVGGQSLHQSLTTGYVAPFQRRVMSTLASGLSYVRTATETALNSDDGVAAVDLDEAVQRGVSAQLCQALGEMTEQVGIQSLDLSFNWAPAEPSPAPPVNRVVFTRPTAPVLMDLRERLTPSPPAERRASVTGYVTRLERGQDAEEGTVTVQGFADTQEQRSVRVLLTGDSYTTAVRAHDARQLVQVSGRLTREGNAYFLRGQVSLSRVTVTTTEPG